MNKEKEFVQNFALELTNRTLEEREEIGRKYYQQLQAKEQECEDLINELIDIKWNIESQNIEIEIYEEQLDQLKAENETQQKALELQKCWIDNLEFQRTKLKQTLYDIKEIAEETSQAKFRNNACIGCAFLNDKILQKISEVEDV